MDIKNLNLSKDFINILQKHNIKQLNPVQSEAIQTKLLNLENSFVISSPTASGKTLIAELMAVKAILEKGWKVLYVVPLRALANEKYESFKERYAKLGIKVAISTGDLDSADSWLQNYDLIVLTSEKTDSLLRHRASWISSVGLAVIDECHLINDAGRGPTLEVTITRLKKLNPKILFLFLSATIKNAHELADWIGAEIIISDWRPVKLHEGVCDGNKVWFDEKESFGLTGKNPSEILIAESTAKVNKQALIFASTRRNAESIAEKCSVVVQKHLSTKDKEILEKLAKKIEGTLESSTPQCKRLAKCVRGGTAFHHAGLVNKQRIELERAFRNRIIKIIAATPTLAAGVDLPAFRVLIRDSRRYYPLYGYNYIPVLEYEQMRGRAGRPRYDSEGESILIARSERKARELYNRFVLGEPEEIVSKLAVEPVLRAHTLALIATEVVGSEEELDDFFASTFWGYQYSDLLALQNKIQIILNQLIKWRFVAEVNGELKATRIGKRVSELYIDPETAHNFVRALEEYKVNEFGLLQLISSAREIAPQLRVRSREFKDIMSELAIKEVQLMRGVPKEWDPAFEDFLDSFKTALMFENWTNEASEDKLYNKFKITPGELHSKLGISDWLVYSCAELAYLLRKQYQLKEIRKLRLRLKYGIREELLPIIRLKGIGRVRSRTLFKAGFKTLADLRKAELKQLAPLIGLKVAQSVKKQLGVMV